MRSSIEEPEADRSPTSSLVATAPTRSSARPASVISRSRRAAGASSISQLDETLVGLARPQWLRGPADVGEDDGAAGQPRRDPRWRPLELRRHRSLRRSHGRQPGAELIVNVAAPRVLQAGCVVWSRPTRTGARPVRRARPPTSETLRGVDQPPWCRVAGPPVRSSPFDHRQGQRAHLETAPPRRAGPRPASRRRPQSSHAARLRQRRPTLRTRLDELAQRVPHLETSNASRTPSGSPGRALVVQCRSDCG